jgi:hypothetical protein
VSGWWRAAVGGWWPRGAWLAGVGVLAGWVLLAGGVLLAGAAPVWADQDEVGLVVEIGPTGFESEDATSEPEPEAGASPPGPTGTAGTAGPTGGGRPTASQAGPAGPGGGGGAGGLPRTGAAVGAALAAGVGLTALGAWLRRRAGRLACPAGRAALGGRSRRRGFLDDVDQGGV